MLENLLNLGLVGLALIAIAITCCVLIANALRAPSEASFELTRRSLLFWGIFAALLGFVGSTIRMFSAIGPFLEDKLVTEADFHLALQGSAGLVQLGIGVFALGGGAWLALGITRKQAESLSR